MRIRLLSLLLLITQFVYSQTKLDVWTKQPNTSKTIVSKLKSNQLPKSFESTLPDGSKDVYDRIQTSPIKVETQSGVSKQYTPIAFKARKNLSFISFTEKQGWQGFTNTKSGKSFMMTPTFVKEVVESENSNLCKSYVMDNQQNEKQSIQTAKTPQTSQLLTNADFYNPLIPINKTCKVYVEVSYALHQQIGNDDDATLAYVTNTYLGVSYIFAREGITLKLNKVFIWNQNDLLGYDTQEASQGALINFKSYINLNNPTNPESHFKQLLTLKSYGGVGGLNGRPNGFENPYPWMPSSNCVSVVGVCNGSCSLGGFTGPANPPTNINNFNWNLQVITHELGHNLGSQHTHWCGWKNDLGNFINVLDSCMTVEVTPSNTAPCNLSWFPLKTSTYPTIMSYCYLKPVYNPPNRDNILINGFGKYPRWSIRSNLYQSSQLPEDSTPVLPIVTTSDPVNITPTSFNSGGQITNESTITVLSKGICYSTTNDPNINGSVVLNEFSVNPFDVTVTNLQANTRYYYRAFATNNYGVGYGELKSFMTLPPTIPSLTTKDPINITNTSAQSGGVIRNNGGTDIIQKGVCWSTTNQLPTYDELNTQNQTNDGSGNSEFNSNLSGLLSSKTYYVRSYAKNSIGIGYGTTKTFTTNTSATVLFTNFQTLNVFSTNATTTVTLSSDGGSPITARGVCWKLTSLVIETGLPTISNSKTTSGSGGLGAFTSSLSPLTSNTSYTVRAYATNANGTFYSNPITFTTTLQPNLVLSQVTVDPNVSDLVISKLTLSSGTNYKKIGLVFSQTNTLPTINSNTYNQVQTCPVNNPNCYAPSTTPYEFQSYLDWGTWYIRGYVVDDADNYFYTTNVSTVNLICKPLFYDMREDYILGISPTTIGILSQWQHKNTPGCGPVSLTNHGLCWSVNPEVPTINSPTKISFGPFNFNSGTTYLKQIYRITGLTPNTVYAVRSFIQLADGSVLYSPIYNFTTLPPSPPITQPLSFSVTNNSAKLGVKIFDDGGTPVSEYGALWAIYPTTPTIESVGSGSYISTKICNPPCSTNDQFNFSTKDFSTDTLLANTPYYVRGWARNTSGQFTYSTYFGLENFKTLTLPLFTTNVTQVTHNSAQSGGNLNNDYGFSVTSRGIVWSTSPGPNISLPTKTVDGIGLGTFTSSMTNLLPGQLYYVKSYAVLSSGRVLYGEEKTFTTYPLRPTVEVYSVTQITYNSAKIRGRIIYRGQNSVVDRGFIWGPTSSSQTTTILCSNSPSCTIQGDTFTVTLDNLTPITNYTVTAFATNNCDSPNPQPNICSNCCIGTSVPKNFATPTGPPIVITNQPTGVTSTTAVLQGQVTETYGLPLTMKGFVWSVYNNIPLLGGYASNNVQVGSGPVGPQTFSKNTTLQGNPTPSVVYVRAYAMNSQGIGYGEIITIIQDYRPKVTTLVTAATSLTTASSGGNVTSQGVAPLNIRGVCWSTTTQSPTPENSPFTNNGVGTGQYTSFLSNLTPGGVYFVRAFARNFYAGVVNTGYGEVFTIQTPQFPDNGNCDVQKSLIVSKENTTKGLVWVFRFEPNQNCSNYKVELSRYSGDPTTNPSLVPVQTQVLNSMNPYFATVDEVAAGVITRIMSPQPKNTGTTTIWYSVNVICNSTLCGQIPVSGRTTKTYFSIGPAGSE